VLKNVNVHDINLLSGESCKFFIEEGSKEKSETSTLCEYYIGQLSETRLIYTSFRKLNSFPLSGKEGGRIFSVFIRNGEFIYYVNDC
jgi:hypothetical protein